VLRDLPPGLLAPPTPETAAKPAQRKPARKVAGGRKR
jgi:hypothetical protein